MKTIMDLSDNTCQKDNPLDKVTEDQVLEIQIKLNNRPRKLLGFKTPAEVYQEMVLAG